MSIFTIIHSCYYMWRWVRSLWEDGSGMKISRNFKSNHPYITSAKELGGWGQKNDNFCWRSVLFMLTWVRESQKMCWRNIGMVPKIMSDPAYFHQVYSSDPNSESVLLMSTKAMHKKYITIDSIYRFPFQILPQRTIRSSPFQIFGIK